MFNHFKNWRVPGWRAAALQHDAEPCLYIVSANNQAELSPMLHLIKQNLQGDARGDSIIVESM